MDLQQVTYEEALDLKELGYPFETKLIEDAPVEWQGKAFFTGMCSCARFPYLIEVTEWLRKEKNIHIYYFLNQFTGIGSENLTRYTGQMAYFDGTNNVFTELPESPDPGDILRVGIKEAIKILNIC